MRMCSWEWWTISFELTPSRITRHIKYHHHHPHHCEWDFTSVEMSQKSVHNDDTKQLTFKMRREKCERSARFWFIVHGICWLLLLNINCVFRVTFLSSSLLVSSIHISNSNCHLFYTQWKREREGKMEEKHTRDNFKLPTIQIWIKWMSLCCSRQWQQWSMMIMMTTMTKLGDGGRE